jgi:hypothetical protein
MTTQQCQPLFDALGEGVSVSLSGGWAYLSWADRYGSYCRRWDARGANEFPTWDRRAGWGGTNTRLFNQLVRRLLGKPTHPRFTMAWLAKSAGHGRADQFAAALAATDWPEEVPCVLCGKPTRATRGWWAAGTTRKPACGPACSTRDCRLPPREPPCR